MIKRVHEKKQKQKSRQIKDKQYRLDKKKKFKEGKGPIIYKRLPRYLKKNMHKAFYHEKPFLKMERRPRKIRNLLVKWRYRFNALAKIKIKKSKRGWFKIQRRRIYKRYLNILYKYKEKNKEKEKKNNSLKLKKIKGKFNLRKIKEKSEFDFAKNEKRLFFSQNFRIFYKK